ncbi:GDP-Man:Man(3)GlcNAc(2)-PP-Dol alpha-1,2-mannosyltransferase-like [Saccostrea echinata]|uniref:GDP-Man:Man(3)GlcNAc(2)-PP-Dol alpha-1,2-mannosyltransferase-like n=1 Tax=Saccostrea echinata TaxID=191078 RepID=UPI002A7F9941|nr:GDP-Man:Man(3)GlcNAc(2)-PP-Dol alpha-1,2-mannosyltransferase-like [Saccostrea echinata]
MAVLLWLLYAVLSCISLLTLTVLLLRIWLTKRRRTYKASVNGKSVIGFFHPYCNAGGGGERVLWVAIRAIQKKYPSVVVVVYTGDTDASPGEIMQRAHQRFNIVLQRPINFIFLTRRRWVEAYMYPYLTLLGQSLGSVLLGWEALWKCVPDIYIDSMGYAFTFPLFRYLGNCRVGCYVHYPTVSTDMLEKVSSRREGHNNPSFITRSWFLSTLKVQYYKLFALLFGWAGRSCHVAIVNSTWTFGHIKQLWQMEDRTHIVYPPCDINEFVKIPLDCKRSNHILSISQFRPEKDHPLQIKSFHKFISTVTIDQKPLYKLLLVGSCRNQGDRERVDALRKMCTDLDIVDNVEFKLNVSFDELKSLMSTSVVGLHTMWNEHFGIGVVELMAAGCIVLAHDSGGPKLDIVVPVNGQPTGFLASDVDSYASYMSKIFKLSEQERTEIQHCARVSVQKFSDTEFENGFLDVYENLVTKT